MLATLPSLLLVFHPEQAWAHVQKPTSNHTESHDHDSGPGQLRTDFSYLRVTKKLTVLPVFSSGQESTEPAEQIQRAS